MFKLSAWKQAFRRRNQHEDMVPTTVDIDSLRKVYPGKMETLAVNNISMSLSPGDIVIAIGPNGSGKSTLINMLSGTLEATSGSIRIGGKEVGRDFSGLYARLGIVFQDDTIAEKLTTREHLEIISQLNGASDEETLDEVMRIASLLQLTEVLDNQAGMLSGGQKRKLCIGMAFIRHPSIIIMDEPTAGLDAQSRQLVWKIIHESQGITGFISSHSLEEGESVSNRILVVVNGKAAFCGTATEMRTQFKCGYYLTFVDDVCMKDILEFLQQIEPAAELDSNRPKAILVPDKIEMADLLENLDLNKDRFGVTKYTVHLENLEETLRKLIEDEEAKVH